MQKGCKIFLLPKASPLCVQAEAAGQQLGQSMATMPQEARAKPLLSPGHKLGQSNTGTDRDTPL